MVKYFLLFILVLINLHCINPYLGTNQYHLNKNYEEKLRDKPLKENACRQAKDLWNKLEPCTYKMKNIYNTSFQAGSRPTGRIVFKWAINSKGIVIFDTILENNFEDSVFVNKIRKLIKKIKYTDISINCVDDITEVAWPFVFKDYNVE